jgi:hypothetical protein
VPPPKVALPALASTAATTTNPNPTRASPGPLSLTGVFGGFCLKPALKISPLLNHAGIDIALHNSTIVAKEFFIDWVNEEAANRPVHSADLDEASAFKTDLPAVWHPLWRAIHLRRIVWGRAELLAPKVFAFADRLVECRRQVDNAIASADHYISRAELMNNPQDEDLDGLASKSHQASMWSVRLRCLLVDLCGWGAQATTWEDSLQSSWTRQDLPDDARTLQEVVRGLVQWQDEAATLAVHLSVKRQQIWKAVLGDEQPNPALKLESWYVFGCPVLAERANDVLGAIETFYATIRVVTRFFSLFINGSRECTHCHERVRLNCWASGIKWTNGLGAYGNR